MLPNQYLCEATPKKEVALTTETTMYKTILLAVIFALVSSVAMAQVRCGQRENIVKWLAAKHNEGSIAFGVTISGSLVEVLSTKEGETWTIIITSSEGSSCIVAVGEGWRTKEYQEHFAEPQT